jgi:hypothetical protein
VQPVNLPVSFNARSRGYLWRNSDQEGIFLKGDFLEATGGGSRLIWVGLLEEEVGRG